MQAVTINVSLASYLNFIEKAAKKILAVSAHTITTDRLRYRLPVRAYLTVAG